ncbi:MAG TPA: TolC family protein [Fimbriimonadaceae bacterium]|nr:TolC family protein [Fimbriimonadaceae bacterium]
MSLLWAAGFVSLGHGALHQAGVRLEDLVAQALKSNPAVLGATQKVEEASSHVAEVEGHRRLQLSLNGTASASTGQVAQPVANQTFGTIEAGLIAPIPNFAKAGAEVEQAVANLSVARAQLRRVQLDIEFRTVSAAYELRRSIDGRQIAQENLDQAQRQETDTKTRISHGDLPPADLLKAQVPVAQDRAALVRAKSEVRIARQVLNDLLQRNLNEELDVALQAEDATPPVAPDQALSAALQGPDVAEAKAQVQAAEANERIARRGRDPDFAFQLTHARTGDPTAYSYLSTLALTVSLPLTDGGVTREQVRQARLQTDQARTALKQAEQRTRLAVEEALLDVESDQASVAATAETEAIAKESLAKSRQSYQAGLTTTRDVLDAQLIYSQARIQTNSARYDLAIAQAHLRQLLATPTP